MDFDELTQLSDRIDQISQKSGSPSGSKDHHAALREMEDEEEALRLVREHLTAVKDYQSTLKRKDDLIRSLKLSHEDVTVERNSLESRLIGMMSRLEELEQHRAGGAASTIEMLTGQSELLRGEIHDLSLSLEEERSRAIGERARCALELDVQKKDIELLTVRNKALEERLLSKNAEVLDLHGYKERNARLEVEARELSEREAFRDGELIVLRGELDERTVERDQWKRMHSDLEGILMTLNKQISALQTNGTESQMVRGQLEEALNTEAELREALENMCTLLNATVLDVHGIVGSFDDMNKKKKLGEFSKLRSAALLRIGQKLEIRATPTEAKGGTRRMSAITSSAEGVATGVVRCVKELADENLRLYLFVSNMNAALSDAASTTEQALQSHRRQESALHIHQREAEKFDRIYEDLNRQLEVITKLDGQGQDQGQGKGKGKGKESRSVGPGPIIYPGAPGTTPSAKRAGSVATLCSNVSSAIQLYQGSLVKLRRCEVVAERAAKASKRDKKHADKLAARCSALEAQIERERLASRSEIRTLKENTFANPTVQGAVLGALHDSGISLSGSAGGSPSPAPSPSSRASSLPNSPLSTRGPELAFFAPGLGGNSPSPSSLKGGRDSYSSSSPKREAGSSSSSSGRGGGDRAWDASTKHTKGQGQARTVFISANTNMY
jgi:hypothetical protein